MLEQRPQPEVECDLAREVELPVLAVAHGARERAHDVRKRSHQCRVAAERARWRSQKQHLRGRRLRVRSDELCAPRLVLLGDASQQGGPGDDRGLGA